MIEQKSIFTSREENAKEAFIESRKQEFAQFDAAIQNKSDVAGLYRMHDDRLAHKKQLHGGLVEHVGTLKNADFAQSVYRFVSDNGATMDRISQAASQLGNAEFIARHADRILEISAQEIADYEAGFAQFRQNNAVTLKQLGLPHD